MLSWAFYKSISSLESIVAQQLKALFLSLFVVLGLAACGDSNSPEAMLDKGVKSMGNMTDILKKITDEDSANEHKGALGKAFGEFKAFAMKGKALEKTMSKEKLAELKKLGQEKMKPVMAAFQEQMKRIQQNPKIAAILKPALEKFMK